MLSVGVGTALQAVIATSNLRWYGGLLKPTFSPDPWLAALAALAIAATVSAGFFRVLCRPDYLPDRPAAIWVIGLGLALDVVWTWLFFAGRHPTVALAAAGALAVMVASAAWHAFGVDRRAGLLLLPWVAAAGVAFLLDLSIALRNG